MTNCGLSFLAILSVYAGAEELVEMCYRLVFPTILSLLFIFIVAGCAEQFATDTNAPSSKTPSPTSKVSFNDDIRPILNKNCTGCHGGVSKQGGISYIIREQALGRGKSGRRNVVPGNAKASELFQRITSKDPVQRMPYGKPPLKQEEIDLLERWIDEGAEWEKHWAFVAPERPELPPIEDVGWARSPIDHFVSAKMEESGFAPNPEASKKEWLRRVSLDLVGLPPSPGELDAFLTDTNDRAYERHVDRLLSSSRFGERWASTWLDIARYADSAGYEKDTHREVWPYRDWVIKAFNDNLPYDEFIITQLAGDLLPDADLNDHIATVFNRLTQVNHEGGTDDEEFRIVAAMDRVATAWSALNGLTMNCVQCHSHPYDPLEHTEYYASLAFFNTSQDADKDDDSPLLSFATDEVERVALYLKEDENINLQTKLAATGRGLATESNWRSLNISNATIDEKAGWAYLYREALQRWDTFSREQQDKATSCAISTEMDNPGLGLGLNDQASDCQAASIARAKQAYLSLKYAGSKVDAFSSTQRAKTSLPVTEGEYINPSSDLADVGEFSFSVTVPDNSPNQTIEALKLTASPLDPDKAAHTAEDGFGIDRIHLEIHRKKGYTETVGFKGFIPDTLQGIQHLTRTSGTETNGDDRTTEWRHGFVSHRLFGPVTTIGVFKEPIMLEAGDKLVLKLAQLQKIQPRDGKPYFFRRLHLSAWPEGISGSNLASLLDSNNDYLMTLTRSIVTDRDIRNIDAAYVPVMREQLAFERRSTRVFERGNFLAKTGDDIPPNTPAIFPSLFETEQSPLETRPTRLDLAKWFVSEKHPLTARVAVNRLWEQLFGLGLVETLEDFGSIGAKPSHPDLLDWLAVEFQHKLDWNIKAILKQIVLSSTYRQQAAGTAADYKSDPQNKWLSRGPRQRLTAEMVRDQALFVGGLLSNNIGGEPVMPPQPDGVWKTIYDRKVWDEATGDDRYRRAVYTYMKRSTPYPSFEIFDDAGHAVSAPRRMTTNTPLQALVTLNDIAYYEAAEGLGRKMRLAAETDDFAAGINLGFKSLLARSPTSDELNIIKNTYDGAMKANAQHSDATQRAWTDLASTLLNLDESLNR
ncbi:MAG: PSD1 and planctomycete cytochrome C domain-containing protein [Pseudomonadota bacterium]